MPYGEDITINVGDAVRIHPNYKNYKFKKLKFGVTYFVETIDKFNGKISTLRHEVGSLVHLNMDKRYFEHTGKEENVERNYELEVGDVVLVVESGYGVVEEDVGKYLEVVGFGDYYGEPGVAVKAARNYLLQTDITVDNKVGYETFGNNPMILLNTKEEVKDGAAEQYTGSSSNYYRVFVKNPTTLETPYEAECNDIIESLKMTFAEGNAFKAIWRKAKARQGVKKRGYDNGVYDSEKVVFFGERMLIEAKEDE